MKSKRKPAFLLKMLYGLIAGLLIGISALALFLLQDRLREPDRIDTGQFKVEGAADFDGAIKIEPPLSMPDFSLSNQDGAPTRLSDLRGRFVMLTFGFTNCPDICPLTLNDFRRIRDMLSDLAESVKFVFISVDGTRDTPEVLRSYIDFRKLDGVIGLTGEEAAVRAVGAPYGLSFEISGEDSGSGYSVNHTAGSYLLDPHGRWIMRYQFGVPPDMIAADLQSLLAG